MLGRKDDQLSDVKEAKLDTVLGKETAVKGDIVIKGSLRIDGRVEGLIDSSDTVVIGKTGQVSGEVKAKDAVIAGQVAGNVVLSSRGVLESGSRLNGDIICQGLIIHEGAFFEGRCERCDGKSTRAADASAQKAAARTAES
jgi:cytoskeletal protein CcmA (bactofilin family)